MLYGKVQKRKINTRSPRTANQCNTRRQSVGEAANHASLRAFLGGRGKIKHFMLGVVEMLALNQHQWNYSLALCKYTGGAGGNAFFIKAGRYEFPCRRRKEGTQPMLDKKIKYKKK